MLYCVVPMPQKQQQSPFFHFECTHMCLYLSQTHVLVTPLNILCGYKKS